MSVLGAPPFTPAGTAGTSGAAASPVCVREATRGAEPALISSLGLAGPVVVAAKLIAEGRFSRFGRSGEGASARDSLSLMGMKLGEGLLANLDVRTRGGLRGRKLNDIGHGRKEFRGFRGSGGIDQGLTWVRRVNGVRVDALARVKCVHTGLSGRRVRLRFRRGFGLRARNMEKRQVLDGA